MSNKPFFSVIIATYNRAEFIVKTIESIINQKCQDFEIIIVDDGSTDNTEDVLIPYVSDKILYFKKENAERGAARNVGIKKANGVFLTFIDSDDLMYDNHLEVAIKFLNENDEVVFYGQGYETKTQLGEVLISHQEILNPNQSLLKGNFLSCIGVFIKRQNFVNEGYGFSEIRKFSGTEDWACWLQVLARYRLCYQNIVTACMIEHDSRSVLHFKEQQLLDRTNLLVEILINDKVFVTVFGKQTIDKIEAHMLSYGSLHLALSKQKMQSINWYLNSLKKNWKELFTRRFLATVKIILLK